jgi:tetratricopeptide (TPR) repeat protein
MRYKLFPAIFVLGLLLATSRLLLQESQAQQPALSGQISGQVRYSDGGQPAFNIIVNCDAQSGGSCGQEMTDRNGRFRFTGLALASYIISVRVPGYTEQRQEVELLTTPSANLQFQLRPDGSARATPVGSSLVDAKVPGAAKKEFDQAAALVAAGKKESLTEAIRHLEKAVNIYPQYVEANLMLGTTYMDLSQWDKAEDVLKRTVELDPQAGNALLALGELYFRQKKAEDAEKVLVRGLAIENRSYQGHLALARVYFDISTRLKDEAQAKPVLEKAYEQVNQSLRLKPDFAQAHLVKGNLLLRVRRAEDAKREFEEYLRLDPKGPFADQTRAVVEKISKALAAEKKP